MGLLDKLRSSGATALKKVNADITKGTRAEIATTKAKLAGVDERLSKLGWSASPEKTALTKERTQLTKSLAQLERTADAGIGAAQANMIRNLK